jgi:hypothetical protein
MNWFEHAEPRIILFLLGFRQVLRYLSHVNAALIYIAMSTKKHCFLTSFLLFWPVDKSLFAAISRKIIFDKKV